MIVRFYLILLFLSFLFHAPLHAQPGTCSNPQVVMLDADGSAYYTGSAFQYGTNSFFPVQDCSGDPSPEPDYVYVFTAPEDGNLVIDFTQLDLFPVQGPREVLTIKTNCSIGNEGLIDCIPLYEARQYYMSAGSLYYLIVQGGESSSGHHDILLHFTPESDNANNVNCSCTAYTAGNICESFDNYTADQYISYQSPCWTPWDGVNGSSIDGIINSAEGVNGSSALEINDQDDVMMYLGDRTNGQYNLSFNLKRKSGSAAHFNLRQQFVANTSHGDDLTAYAVFLLPNDEGYYFYRGNTYQFSYDSEGWIKVDNLIDLDNDLITLYINGTEIASWPYSYDLNNTGNNPVILDAVNFWSYDSQNYTYEFYVDNLRLVNLSDLPSCEVSNDELLCTSWLRSELETLSSNYTDCGAVNYEEFVFASRLEDNNGNTIIAIYDNAFIDGSFGYYYDCTGTYIGSSFSSFISSYDPPYLEDYLPAFDSFELLWDCTQPLPDCDNQPPQASDCTPDPNFTDFYQNDAEVLAAVQMINDPAYASTIEIPTDLFDFYYDRLNAVFNATGIPERDTVVECLNIHAVSLFFSTTTVDIRVSPGTDWAQQLIDGFSLTSNADVNDIITLYNLTLESFYQPTGSNWTLNLQADHHLNTQALANLFLNIVGVENASPFSFTFTGGGPGFIPLFVEHQNGYSDFTFEIGWDCFGGLCAGIRSWTFRVFDDCSVQFLASEGNPLEPSIGCNLGYQCATEPLCLPWIQDTINYYQSNWADIYTDCSPTSSGVRLQKIIANGNTYLELSTYHETFVHGPIHYYTCDGSLLGKCVFGGLTECDPIIEDLYLSPNKMIIWDCSDPLPDCQSCPEINDILCLDWLSQTNLGEQGISYNEQEEIIVLLDYAAGGGFLYSFFDCSGQLVHECASNNINDPSVNCDAYYNGLVQNAIELLGPFEPLPDCYDCPVNPNEVLCLPWLNTQLQNLDCTTCPYDNNLSVTNEIYFADLNGTTGIVIRTQCGFNYLHHRFFECDGNLLYDCYEENLMVCNNWNDNIELGAQIWNCDQNDPDCNTNVSYTLTPQLPSTTPCTGEIFCVPFTVNDFSYFTDSRVDMSWDANVLGYHSVGNLNPQVTGLDLSDFDLSYVSNGQLVLDWEAVPCEQSQSGDGITLSDGEVFFEVCFTTIGGDGQSTSFEMAPDSYAHKAGIGCINNLIGMQPNLVETCGDGLVDCSTDIEDIQCLDWLYDYIQNIDCSADCPNAIELYTYQSNQVIAIYTGGGCPPLLDLPRFDIYTCDGVFLFEANSGIPQEFTNPELVWDCSQTLPNCNDAPWTPQTCASGNTHFIQVIYSELESEIGGVPLSEGDWLGVFYQKDDGSLVCLDQAQFEDPAVENGFQLTACAESSPGADDGFTLDEPFQFKIFKDGVEYDAGEISVSFWGIGELIPPVYPEATSRFEGGSLSSVIRTIRDFPDIEDPSCDTPIPISCGQSLQGNNENGTDIALSYNCFTNVVDGPEVVYTFTTSQEEDVLITLDGLTDDLELLLLDACDRDHCIAKSERTGATPEVIHYEDLPAGDYFIIVDGYIGYESEYTLSLDCGDFPQGEFTCDAETIACGDVINASTVDGCNEVNYYSCGEAYTPGKERIYRIRFEEPINVRISLQVEDTDLDLFFLDALDPERCIYFSNESGTELERILIDDNDIIPNRDYYIIVDEYQSNDGGSFELSVECAPDGPPCPWCPPPVICDDVPEIACNNTITGNTQSGQSRVEKWGDCASYNIGPELIYHFYNPEIQDVQFVLGDFTENLNFYVLRGDCSVKACDPDWQGNKSGLIEESILITAMPEGDYYLVVDSYDASSSFSLEVKCNETINDCFEVLAVQDFSYISSNVRPNDPDIANILNPNDYAGVNILLSDDQMRTYNPHFTSPNDPNAIKVWDVASGYRIDVSEPITITFCGENADTFQIKNVSIDVLNNYIAYPFQSEMQVKDVFADSPSDNLVSVIYWPPNNGSSQNYNLAFDIGENFNMIPGNGYILRVSQNGEFSYRNNEEAFSPNGCTYFRTPIRNTMQRAFVMAEHEVLSDLLSPGDELGFFNKDGLICGSGKYNGFNLIITLQGDNLQTESTEGYVENDPMILRWWQQSSGRVQEVEVSFQEHDPLYEHNYIYKIEGLHIASNQLSRNEAISWNVYPNPTRHQISVEYHISQTSNVAIQLLDTNGHSLMQFNRPYAGGTHQQIIDMSNLPQGIYFLQLTTAQGIAIKKVVKQ
jgi:hypothetical protein